MSQRNKSGLPMSVAGLMAVVIMAGIWQTLPVKEAKATVNTYTVNGANPGAFPLVGAASATLPSILITEDGGADDFTAPSEVIVVAIDAVKYPSVVFDQTVVGGDLVITGTCLYTAASSITYPDAHTANITVTGTPCGVSSYFTIAGLKIKTLYAQSAPGAGAFISIDSSTPYGSPISDSDTINLPVLAADAAASITLGANSVVNVSGNTVFNLTVPVDLASGDTVTFVAPANLDVSTPNFIYTTGFSYANFSGCANAGGQTITCTANGVINAVSGGIGIGGIKSLYAASGLFVTGVVVHDLSASADLATTSSGAVTATTPADANATLILGTNSVVGAAGSTTLHVTIPINMAAGDTVGFIVPANLDVSGVVFVSKTFGGAGTFSGCSPSGQAVICTTSGAITAGTGDIVMSGIKSLYAASGQTISGVVVHDTSASADTATDASGTVTATTPADAAATLTLGANSVVGVAGSTTLNFTVPIALVSGDTVTFVAPANLDVSAPNFITTNGFAFANFSGCANAGGQTVTCTANGPIGAVSGGIVMGGIRSLYAASGLFVTGVVVHDLSASADTATDASGTVTATTPASALAHLTLGANATVGASGATTLTVALPIDLVSGDTVAFTAPANLDVSTVAFASQSFSGSGTFSGCAASGQTVTCTAGGAIAGTGTIVMNNVISKYAAVGALLAGVTVNTAASKVMATGNDGSTPVTTTVAADAAASLTLGANSTVGVAGSTTLTLTIPVDLVATDVVRFVAPASLDVSSVAFTSMTFGGAGLFSCVPSSQTVICTTNGAITAGTGNIVMSGIKGTYADPTPTISAIAVTDTVHTADRATDSSGPMTGTGPGALTGANVQPSSLIASATGTATVSFTTDAPIPADGKIVVTFGAGFSLTGVGAADGTCSTMDGTFVTSVSSHTVTLARQNDGLLQTPGVETCTIGNVINPATGSTGTYSVQTTTAGNDVIDQDNAVAADTVVDFMSGAVTGDNNGNGQIDKIVLSLNADVTGGSVSGTDFTVSGYAVASASRTGASQITVVLTESGTADTDVVPTVDIVSSITLAAGGTVSSGSIVSTDGAAPVLISSTPANAATGVSLTNDFTLVFSEPMDVDSTEAAFSLTPAAGANTFAWDFLHKTLTVNPANSLAGNQAYTINLAVTAASAAAGDPDLGATSVAFTSASAGGGGGGGGGAPSYSLTVTRPNGGEILAAGSTAFVNWSSNVSSITAIRISLSTDGGATFPVTVANIAGNNGNYSWVVPSMTTTTTARIKVGAVNSGTAVYASDMSDANFTVSGTAPAENAQPNAQPQAEDSTITGPYSSSAALGNTMTIGIDKDLPITTGTAACVNGSLIKASLKAVYYCGSNNRRYVFPNQGTYFSWYADFLGVVTLSDAQLASIPLGGNVTYRPGKKMIKVQSDPKVYAISRGGLLRWVTSEAVAASLYGADWNKQIDDVSDAFFVNYTVGEPLTTSNIVP